MSVSPFESLVSVSVSDSYAYAITGVNACAEYDLCSGTDAYLCYRVPFATGAVLHSDGYVFYGDGSEVATSGLRGREYVSMFVAVYDALIMYTDDSAVEEILLELESRGELEAFWSFALERGLSVSYKEYLEYLFLGGREVPVPESFY